MPTINQNPPIQPSPAIVSTTPIRNEFYTGLNGLNQLELQGDPFNEVFQQMMQNNKVAQDNAIASATAAGARAENAEEKGRARYTAGINTAGIKSGAARYLPEYQAGVIESARRSYQDRFQQLDQAEKLAIAQAKQARNEADTRVLTDKLNYIKQLRKEKADALESAQKMEWEKYKFEKSYALDAYKAYNSPESTKAVQKDFNNRLNTLFNAKTGTIDGTSGIPYFEPKTGYLTVDGFKKLLQYAEQSEVERADFLKQLKPYLHPKFFKNYGISVSEFDEI